jgi:hypothetical protein
LFTARYLAGRKAALNVHFFAAAELDMLFAGYDSVLRPRLVRTGANRARMESGGTGGSSQRLATAHR